MRRYDRKNWADMMVMALNPHQDDPHELSDERGMILLSPAFATTLKTFVHEHEVSTLSPQLNTF